MKRRSLAILVTLATLSVVGVVLIQILWLDRAFRMQHEQLALQRQQQLQLDKQFNDRVVIALTDVTEQILSINKDPSDLFDAVKQERPNYFAVTINDTLHPYLLESLLRKEFRRRGIGEDFEYGIYDCFTDSIVYGNYVGLDTVDTDTTHTELMKLDKDGHYFGVYFPRRHSALWSPEPASRSTWTYPAIVTLIVFGFFAYSVWLIMRQKRLSEMKNDFIGNMTHELKTPISTIALSSEVIADPGIVREPERLAAYARIIRSETERLRAQVDRVLQLTTLERDGPSLRTADVDLHGLIRDIAASFKLVLEERRGELALELRAAHPVVRGDRAHLTNALSNLVDNAIKYSPEAPRITVSTRDAGGDLAVEVADHGIGIAREHLRHVFERFYRVPTGNVHDVKGFGLGLHHVQQIIKAHRGSVRVHSEPGRGSRFTVLLPRSTSTA